MSKNMRKPLVCILQNQAEPHLLAEICAGLEEEGVAYAVREGQGSALELAHAAALQSLLQVGVGLAIDGATGIAGVALQIRNLPPDRPVFHIIGDDPQAYRRLGTNAARAVKGDVFT